MIVVKTTGGKPALKVGTAMWLEGDAEELFPGRKDRLNTVGIVTGFVGKAQSATRLTLGQLDGERNVKLSTDTWRLARLIASSMPRKEART